MVEKKSSANPLDCYLTYAKNLKATEPIIALCCKTFYVQKFIEAKKQSLASFSPAETKKIQILLRESEEEKKEINFAAEQGQAAVEDFCTRQFVGICKDEQDPKNPITRNHAVQFRNTANFIDLLSVYGELPPDWEEKSKINNLI